MNRPDDVAAALLGGDTVDAALTVIDTTNVKAERWPAGATAANVVAAAEVHAGGRRPWWLWPARLVWIAGALISVALFVTSIPASHDLLQNQFLTDIGVSIAHDPSGNAIIQTWNGAAAARAGILAGDILVAINGVPVRRGADAMAMLDQRAIGAPLMLSYRTVLGTVARATIRPDFEQAGPLAWARLPVGVLILALLAIESLAALVYVAVAALIFWRRSDDWPALLVSLALLIGFVGVTWPHFVLFVFIESQPWLTPGAVWNGLAAAAVAVALYLFPDGRFLPRWTRLLTVLAVLWAVVLPVVISIENQEGAGSWYGYDTTWLQWQVIVILASTGLFGSGVLAQIVRYRCWASPVQRQQTKWVLLGAGAAVVGTLGRLVGETLVGPDLSWPWPLYAFIVYPAMRLLQALLPLALAVAILRYRLWEIDRIIRHTLVYGILVAILALVYGAAVLLLQGLSQVLTGPQPAVVIVAVTLVLVALIAPLRQRIQDGVDRRFYRERVDARQALSNFAHEVRTLIELPELLQALVTRTTDLLHITHGAVFLAAPEGAFHLAAARGFPADSVPVFAADRELHDRLRAGPPLSRPRDAAFPLLVPLLAPPLASEGTDGDDPALIGVLALGPRRSEQEYARDDQALLASLADQAGTALHVAQLIAENRAEAARRAQSDQQLDAYRASPMGQAETLSQTLIAHPESALIDLHRLAQRAGHDSDAAALLGHLSQTLAHQGAETLSTLAAGITYVVAGQAAPEVVPTGLRLIVEYLDTLAGAGQAGAAVGLALYRLCRQALDARTIAAIVALRPDLRLLARPPLATDTVEAADPPAQEFAALRLALGDLGAVADALDAYRRVDTTDDRLAYLVAAVERLGRVRRDLGSADRAIVHGIVDGWLAVVSGAMRDVQTRAEISCTLLTRQSWHADVVPLGLRLHNGGHAAALHLQVVCDPAPEYTALDGPAEIARLAPGAAAHVELRVRPRLPAGVEQLRVHISMHYGDPRDPQQVEVFTDMVTLLPLEQDFQHIANPYVVGTPLAAGSPLFVGREDLFAFIQEHFSAAHRHNLVLIGQRRTGKTSLLKQLPARLGDDILAIYLDGQALGLDPGLPSFFLTLATEISYACAERGLAVAPPNGAEFAAAPAGAFERDFLARVRAASGQRHLLLLVDEFEELEAAVRRGTLDTSIFGFLRHLMQHTARLSVIFCGTHHLEELTAEYWHGLFNIALHRQVGFLDRPEALRLIQDPVAPFGMRYDDLALDKMWQVTSGHPYFLQLLCHGVVQHQNTVRRGYVTVADINSALEEMVAAGESHVVYLWAESTPHERLALSALSKAMPLTGHATAAQVRDYLRERGVTIDDPTIALALRRLARRQIIQTTGDVDEPGGLVYRWRLGLVGLWVEAYRPLSHVTAEAQP